MVQTTSSYFASTPPGVLLFLCPPSPPLGCSLGPRNKGETTAGNDQWHSETVIRAAVQKSTFVAAGAGRGVGHEASICSIPALLAQLCPLLPLSFACSICAVVHMQQWFPTHCPPKSFISPSLFHFFPQPCWSTSV